MKRCSPVAVMVMILVLGAGGLIERAGAQEKGSSEAAVNLDALRWKVVLQPSDKGYQMGVYVVTALGHLGGPFVEVRSELRGTPLGLEVVLTQEAKKQRLRLLIKGGPTMSSDMPKVLEMRAYFPLPEKLTEGTYLLCAPQAEFAEAKPKDFWQAKGGLLLVVEKN